MPIYYVQILCAKNWKRSLKVFFKNCFRPANGWLLVSCTFGVNHQKICISFLWDLTLWLSEPQHWTVTLLEFVTHCRVIFYTHAISLNIEIHTGINTIYSKNPEAVFFVSLWQPLSVPRSWDYVELLLTQMFSMNTQPSTPIYQTI